jgi:hypothetical protein
MKHKYILILGSILIAMLAILWHIGFIGLWTKGILYIANNSEKFTTEKGYLIPGEYSVLINLSDLESNIGKELYNDGEHKIYVNWIDSTDYISHGGYRISFRCSGKYSLSSATLVSGIQRIILKNNTFTSYISAKMTAEYNGKIYNSPKFGMTGLNYKDGDAFYFYIFPLESYKNEEISLKEKGKVKLTVTNLYKNVWSKK